MQPAEELRYLMLAVQREGSRTLTEALRPLNLTPAQAEVLRVLQDHQPLSLVALGSLLVCESGSPSRLVNGLVEEGLVRRVQSATNGRMVTLTLTEKGEEQAQRVRAVEAELYEYITRTLEGTALSESIALLWRFVEGRPAGEALARRTGRLKTEEST
ncbi:MAG TPA: winged helix DNA-binding protein [Ktedonosporobacter sp.]|nr:winged helix DNA-binding protein [Ktedonosporobacter sp.]